MVIVILFILGLCLGSFVNALIWRFHKQSELRDQQVAASKPARQAKLAAEIDSLSIAKGRSMCVHCKHELAAKDLIPVVSYIWLRGKCRYCKGRIQDTPLAELVTPLLFVLSYIFWPFDMSGAGLVTFCFWLVFLVGFVALSLYDLRWYELPHEIVFWLIVMALVQVGIIAAISPDHGAVLANAGWGALIIAGSFGLLYRISPQAKDTTTEDDESEGYIGFGARALGYMFGWLLGNRPSRWIGGGDVTLGFLLGLLVGGPTNALLVIFVASLLGTLVALPLMLSGKASRTSHLPFGPFLMAAAVVVMLWGTRAIDWYTGLFV